MYFLIHATRKTHVGFNVSTTNSSSDTESSDLEDLPKPKTLSLSKHASKALLVDSFVEACIQDTVGQRIDKPVCHEPLAKELYGDDASYSSNSEGQKVIMPKIKQTN